MLQDKLSAMKAASAAKVPPEIKEKMLRSVASLSNSDILQRAIKVGEQCPDFSLTDEKGQLVQLKTLRQQGPVLLSLYRGLW